MKSFIKELFFDREVVTIMKEAKLDEAHRYNLLFSGKITLEEFLGATS